MEGKLVAGFIVVMAIVAGMFMWEYTTDRVNWQNAVFYGLVVVFGWTAWWAFINRRW